MAADDDMEAALAKGQEPGAAAVETGDLTAKAKASLNVIRIGVLAKVDTAEVKRGEKASQLQAQMTTAEGKCEKVVKANPGSEDAIKELRSEMEDLKTKAITYANETYKVLLEKIKVDVNSATTPGAMEAAKVALVAHTKTLNTGEVADFAAVLRKLTMQTAGLSRAKGDSAARKEEKEASLRAPPRPVMHTILVDDVKGHFHNIAESIFEAKGGLRPAIANAASGDAFDKIVNLPIVKKGVTMCKQSLKTGMATVRQVLSGGRLAERKVDEAVQACFGQDVRTKMPLPQAEWANAVFKFELLAFRPSSILVNWAPYCMMSAVVMLSGNAVLAGIKPERVQGSTWAEKRDYLYQCDRDRLVALINDGGWFCRFENGNTARGHSMIVIPSGFMILTAADGATMLRWPLVSDEADKQRVSSGLHSLLDSFPEFRAESQGHAQLSSYLDNHQR